MAQTSPKPQINLDFKTQKQQEEQYLSYVEEIHSKINSKNFDEEEPELNESSSEIYSEHRLRSSSSEKKSSIKFEETQGKLYVVKQIDDSKTVKIPQLDLDNIIQKQKKKFLYPDDVCFI